MGEPSTPQQAPDPALAQEQQQAQNELVKQLQTQAAGDTASIMARFGTRMALSGVAAPSIGGA
jgi:hypothetical protein